MDEICSRRVSDVGCGDSVGGRGDGDYKGVWAYGLRCYVLHVSLMLMMLRERLVFPHRFSFLAAVCTVLFIGFGHRIRSLHGV